VRNGRHGWRLARCKESSGAPELPPPIAATPSARRLSGCALVSCPPSSTRLGCFACATAATDSLALRARGEEEDNRTKPFDVMPPMGVDASCTGPCCCWLPGWGQRSPRWCARSPRISCKGSHGLSLAITYGGRNGRRREVKGAFAEVARQPGCALGLQPLLFVTLAQLQSLARTDFKARKIRPPRNENFLRFVSARLAAAR
jgi:hypothetical protein